MNLSNNFVNVLQNFSLINPSIRLQEGDSLETVSPRKTVLARAKFLKDDDVIDGSGAIYDLTMFLQTVGLSNKPVLEFHGKHFNIVEDDESLIVDGKKPTVRFQNASLDVINTPPDGIWDRIKFNEVISFDLKWDDINRVLRHASILGLPYIAFESDGSRVTLSAVDFGNPTSDGVTIPVNVKTSDKFIYIFRPDNFNLASGVDYHVSLGDQSLWTAKTDNYELEYFIALEQESNREDNKPNITKK